MLPVLFTFVALSSLDFTAATSWIERTLVLWKVPLLSAKDAKRDTAVKFEVAHSQT